MIIPLSVDDGNVGSARFVELPIAGPDGGNLLVMINGLAQLPFETVSVEDGNELRIGTNYKVKDQDVILDASGYVYLSGVQADDNSETGSNINLFLSDVLVTTAASGVIQLKVNFMSWGDLSVPYIGYQANVVLRRPM
jgi:hypothetical protein